MKQLTVRVAAPVLALHLKRWPSDPRDTLDDAVVEPPDSLTFAGFAYRLRSFILHRGATAMQGHYVAVVHQPGAPTSSWWLYNDGLRRAARPTDRSTSRTWKLYICFCELAS